RAPGGDRLSTHGDRVPGRHVRLTRIDRPLRAPVRRPHGRGPRGGRGAGDRAQPASVRRDGRRGAVGQGAGREDRACAAPGRRATIASVNTREPSTRIDGAEGRPRRTTPDGVSRDAERFLDHLAVERGLSDNTLLAYRKDLRRYATFLARRGIR